jgi:exodeoxyribonuclease V alpha subunit
VRNPVLAGVTRGKRLVALVGQRKAAAMGGRNTAGRQRWSKLSKRLENGQI